MQTIQTIQNRFTTLKPLGSPVSKRVAAILFISVLSSACTIQPDYRQATNGEYGYSESRLSNEQYQVSFKTKGSDKQNAENYAKLRAAELTLLNGFDWFVVNDKEIIFTQKTVEQNSRISDTEGYERITDCNLIGCRISYNPQNQYLTGNAADTREIREVETILNIEMGKGPQPTSAQSFDARKIQKAH